MRKLLTYIKSIDFAFLVTLFIMVLQSFHSFYSFYAVSSIEGKNGVYQAAGFSFVFELLAILFLMRGRIWTSRFFSFCILVMNIYYYYTNLTGIELALGMFLSFIIPISLYSIAEEVSIGNKAIEEDSKLIDLRKEMSDLSQTLQSTMQDLRDKNKYTYEGQSDLEGKFLNLQVIVDHIKVVVDELVKSKPGRKKKTFKLEVKKQDAEQIQ